MWMNHIQLESGGDLLSRAVSSQVPSALKGLTSVFGMGTGGTPSPLPPEIFKVWIPSRSVASAPLLLLCRFRAAASLCRFRSVPSAALLPALSGFFPLRVRFASAYRPPLRASSSAYLDNCTEFIFRTFATYSDLSQF